MDLTFLGDVTLKLNSVTLELIYNKEIPFTLPKFLKKKKNGISDKGEFNLLPFVGHTEAFQQAFSERFQQFGGTEPIVNFYLRILTVYPG